MFGHRCLSRIRFRPFGRYSLYTESTFAPKLEHNEDSQHSRNDVVDENVDFGRLRRDEAKCLKVAIIGLPNVGKSTLINRLVDRSVCAAASRCHVTRVKSDAVYTKNESQLVFVDTPGLVSAHELKKFSLEDSFKNDAREAMSKADVVGVVQDASNKYTRGRIQEQILNLVKVCRVGVPSLLIMNKIDKMKKKRDLLSLVRSLTSDDGWPNFSDVFMVSALTNDGIDDLRNYLLDSAKLRDWEYDPNVATDQPIERIIERIVRAKFMDVLPNELPYKLIFQIEQLEHCEDGSISCVVLVKCEKNRALKLVLGQQGRNVKTVALDAEQELSHAFRTTVRVKIAVTARSDSKS